MNPKRSSQLQMLGLGFAGGECAWPGSWAAPAAVSGRLPPSCSRIPPASALQPPYPSFLPGTPSDLDLLPYILTLLHKHHLLGEATLKVLLTWAPLIILSQILGAFLIKL